MSWLLDTDVICQPAKRRGDARVIDWLEREQSSCYTSAVVIAQLAYWVRYKEGRQRVALQAWLTRLVEAGTVREIGCSNLDADQLTEALESTRQSGGRAFIAHQIEYNLLHRNPESNGLKTLSAVNEIALLPYYPLANGLLTGKLRRGEQPQGRLSMGRYQDYLSERNFDVVDKLRTFAEERELSMVQVAIGWLLAMPEVPSVTPGATRPEQVLANVAAADWQPTADDLAVLDSITAPEM